jgi:hypothetical protein
MSKRFLRNFYGQLGSPIVIHQWTTFPSNLDLHMFFNEQSMWFFHIFYLWIVHSFIGVYGTCGVSNIFKSMMRTSRNPMVMGWRNDQKRQKGLQFMSHLVNANNKLEKHDSNYIRVWDIYNVISCAQFSSWNINKFITCFCACWHVGFFLVKQNQWELWPLTFGYFNLFKFLIFLNK